MCQSILYLTLSLITEQCWREFLNSWIFNSNQPYWIISLNLTEHNPTLLNIDQKLTERENNTGHQTIETPINIFFGIHTHTFYYILGNIYLNLLIIS